MPEIGNGWLIRFLNDLAAALQPLPAADTTNLSAAIASLNKLIPTNMKGPPPLMTAPSGHVQILQSDLDNFTNEITDAVGVLNTYIQDLLSQTNLPQADVTKINDALTSLQALEPPAPAPGS